MADVLDVWNGEAVALRDVPRLSVERFQGIVCDVVTAGGRVSALFGRPASGGAVLVTAVVADDRNSRLGLLTTVVEGRWPSLADECPSIQGFERELAEQFGVIPEGHPWLKPVRFEHPHVTVKDAFGRTEPWPTIPGDTPFFRVEGEEIHEVAVGPVHAGIIEPGHFRFQCHGEQVLHLEISLGYQHPGLERPAVGEPVPDGRVAGEGLRHRERARAGARLEEPLGAAVLVPQDDLEVEHLLAVALEAEVARLDHPRVDGPDRDLVDLLARHLEEVRDAR